MADVTKSTNHIYGSGNRSVISNVGGDRKGRPGDPLQANPSFDGTKDNNSTDKYYLDPSARGQQGAMAATHTPGDGSGNAVLQRGGASYTPPEQQTTPLMLASEAQLGGVLDMTLNRLKAGQTKVVVQATNANLKRMLEAQLDMTVARKLILSEQRARVHIGRPVETLDAVVESKLPPIAATVDNGELDAGLAAGVDPGAYIRGELPEDAIAPPHEKVATQEEVPVRQLIPEASEPTETEEPDDTDDDVDDVDDLSELDEPDDPGMPGTPGDPGSPEG